MGEKLPLPPRAQDAADASDRLTSLTHELSNLLDGSMRCLRTAMREADAARGPGGDGLLANLRTVEAALSRMSEAVRSMVPGTTGALLDRRGTGRGVSICVAEAIEHAVHVMRPACADGGVTINMHVDEALRSVPAGPIYPVVVDGLRNGLESIRMVGGGGAVRGTIEVHAQLVQSATGDRVEVRICDDGVGPPVAGSGVDVFAHGYTTKPLGRGIGLAMSLSLLHEVGGSISLDTAEASRIERPGAVLAVMYPVDRVLPGLS